MLEKELFETIVRHTPLISIDMLVMDSEEKVLLGWRKNAPAKDSWFVPGGRIFKNETINDAFKRISFTELGQELDIKNQKFAGIYEHIYPEENFSDKPGLSTHYIVLGFRIEAGHNLKDMPFTQHHEYRWVTVSELLLDKDVHQNVKNFFNNYRLF